MLLVEHDPTHDVAAILYTNDCNDILTFMFYVYNIIIYYYTIYM